MIRRSLAHHHGGATLVEFAFVVPLMIAAVTMILQSGVAFQKWNAMQTVSTIVARCLAIGSPRCTTERSGSAYAVQIGAEAGVTELTEAMVTSGTTTRPSGISYRQVDLAVPVALLGMPITLRSRGMFPIR